IPSGIKAVQEWFPPKDRSVAVGYFNAGTSLGALIAPPVVIFLSLSYGWRAAFVVTGGVGLIWAAAWFLLYDSPWKHWALSAEERAAGEAGGNVAPKARVSAWAILSQRAFWAIAVPRFLAEPAWQTFSFFIPLYLAHERNMDLKQIAIFAWLPFLAADA